MTSRSKNRTRIKLTSRFLSLSLSSIFHLPSVETFAPSTSRRVKGLQRQQNFLIFQHCFTLVVIKECVFLLRGILNKFQSFLFLSPSIGLAGKRNCRRFPAMCLAATNKRQKSSQRVMFCHKIL